MNNIFTILATLELLNSTVVNVNIFLYIFLAFLAIEVNKIQIVELKKLIIILQKCLKY